MFYICTICLTHIPSSGIQCNRSILKSNAWISKKNLRRFKRFTPLCSPQDPTLSSFKALLHNFGITDYRWLLEFDSLRSSVYLMSECGLKAYTPSEHSTVPWPIIWLLARYHKKHRLLEGRVPPISMLRDYLQRFENKIKWRWYFRHEQSNASLSIARSKLLKGHITKSFPRIVPPELRYWIYSVRRSIMNAYQRAVLQSRNPKLVQCNVTALDKFAKTLYLESDYMFMPTDKDGGFIIMSLSQYWQAHDKITNMRAKDGCKVYRIVHDSDLKWLFQPSTYRSLALEIEQVEEVEGLSYVLRSTLIRENIAARMKLLCKTHKSPISFRPVHASCQYAYDPMSRWISLSLDSTLKGIPYLLRDSSDLVDKLGKLSVVAPIYYRLDVQDYFLSGSSSDLCMDSTQEILPIRKKLVLQRALRFILDRQLVTSLDSEGNQVVLQVERGSGMGLPHSGAVADTSLRNLMEKGFVDSPSTLARYDIYAYYRFKDDILIIAKTRTGARAFVVELMKNSKYYAIKVEAVSSTSCKMLDLRIWWDGFFHTKVEVKDTAMGMPLSHESNHPSTIHYNWPKAYIQRLFSLCTKHTDKRGAIDQFLLRLASHHTHSRILSSLRIYADQLLSNSLPKKVKSPISDLSWLVLPYHPAFSRYIREELSIRNSRRDKHVWRHAFSDTSPIPPEPKIMVSLTNKSHTIETWLRRQD
jgi:hypothetical protein